MAVCRASTCAARHPWRNMFIWRDGWSAVAVLHRYKRKTNWFWKWRSRQESVSEYAECPRHPSPNMEVHTEVNIFFGFFGQLIRYLDVSRHYLVSQKCHSILHEADPENYASRIFLAYHHWLRSTKVWRNWYDLYEYNKSPTVICQSDWNPWVNCLVGSSV